MEISPFALERYFAKYEFSAKYLLSSSDCEPMSMSELLSMADEESLNLWNNLKIGYTESQGLHLLRDLLSKTYKGINPNDVLVLVPEEGIFLLMHALLKKGDHIVCTFPAYQSLHEVARSIGCDVSNWQPDEQKGWLFDLEKLDNLVQENTKLIVVNFPHNPTGFVPSKKNFLALVEYTRQKTIYLLSDEMYRFLEIDPVSTLPSACEQYDQAFSISGLSKSFGLPGLRIGWIATKNQKILEQVQQLKDYTTICSSAPSEILAMIALKNRRKIIETQCRRISRNLKILDSFFQDFKDLFQWNRPKGGSICFPRMLNVESTFLFCESLVKESGIMLVPSKMFQYDDQHVRIGFGRENLPQVINQFSEYLNQNMR